MKKGGGGEGQRNTPNSNDATESNHRNFVPSSTSEV